ncbi:hypothetical protein GH733_008361 [Mirounga leonina]|nr:hypothetical protein GH733_008361 [Mirounga leonina]
MQAEISSYSSQESLCPPSNPTLTLLSTLLPYLLLFFLPPSSILTSIAPHQLSLLHSTDKTALLRQNGAQRPWSLGYLKSKGHDGERGAQEPEETSIFCLWKIQTLEPTQGLKKLTGSQDISWISEKADLQEERVPFEYFGGGEGPAQVLVSSYAESLSLRCSLGSDLGGESFPTSESCHEDEVLLKPCLPRMGVTRLRRLAEAPSVDGKAPRAAREDDDDDVPDLVENFDEASKNGAN